MKYVIFDSGGMLHPVIFGDHTTHKQIKLEGCVPVSAGFCKITRYNNVECYGKSESLGLEPKERDEDLLRFVVQNYGTSFFLNYDKL